MTTTDMPVDDWRPGPDLSSRFRTIRRWYSLEAERAVDSLALDAEPSLLSDWPG